MNRRLLAAVLGSVLASGALAEDCSKIADRDARLACFDRGAASSAPTAAPAPQRQQATSRRCQGVTKKGNQCKRNAKAGSSYCYQHGG